MAGRWGNKSHILLHGHNLVLQEVTRRAKGEYVCRASNALGSVSSKPAALNVMCKWGQHVLGNRAEYLGIDLLMAKLVSCFLVMKERCIIRRLE